MHEIDLNDKNIRCDLISDIDINIKKDKEVIDNIIIEKINIRNNKYVKNGRYISIFFDDITDTDNRKKVENILIKELKTLLLKNNLLYKKVLVVGLGNNLSTADSLGPKTIDNIIVTRHLYLLNNVDKNYSEVSKIAPSVFATTGIQTYDIVKGIIKRIKPDYIIVIDSLKSRNIKNINKVIQITDRGIDPGSGVGNQRKELSKKTLGIKVIAIGVPTVVNLHTIVKEFLNEYDIDNILYEKGNDFLVTPKDIDFEIEKLSLLLSNAINKTIHKMTK